MMRFGATVVAVVALLGCVESGPALRLDEPAVAKLYDLPIPHYYATMTLAGQLAAGCASYRYDIAQDQALSEARNAEGRGSLSALALQNAIDVETDVTRRSFLAKHGLASLEGDTCAVIASEKAEQSPLSALLIRS